jgi:stage II sporulation SpoAA-like protein
MRGFDVPITYSIDVPTALITTRCFGKVTLAEVQDHFRELARVWPPVDRLDVLLDLRDQTSLPGLLELQQVAAEISVQIGPHRFGRCAVVTERELIFGSMQMFEVLAGRYFDAFRVFRSTTSALIWLAPKPNASRTLTHH